MKSICILTFEKNSIATELFYQLQKKNIVYIIYTKNNSFNLSQIWQKKRGFRWLLYNHLFRLFSKKYKVGHDPNPSWISLKDRSKNQFIAVDDLNTKETREKLAALDTDIGILIGTSLIKPEVFNIPKNGMINLHQGRIPNYRGAPPAFWEFYNNEQSMSVTVHQVVEKFDAGAILEEQMFSMDSFESFVEAKFYANTLSTQMLVNSTTNRLHGGLGQKRSISKATNTVPSLRILFSQYIDLLKVFFKKEKGCN